MIPCLTFDNHAEFKWLMTDKEKSVHKPIWSYKKILNLESGELVKKYIRFNRNTYSIWTTNNKLYEIQTNGSMKRILLDTYVTPSYANGHYYGINSDNKLTYVKRTESDICIKQSCKFKNVLNIEALPYTSWLIINTSNGCYRVCLKEQTICGDFSLSSSYQLFAIDYDSAIMALCHNDNKLSLIWTSSWKTHHTIRVKPMLDLCVNTKHLVYISLERDIYIIDCVSGEDLFIIASQWNHPRYIYINEVFNTLYTIDDETSVLSLWDFKKVKHKWKPMPISPGVNLISTIPLNKKITSVCFNTNQIIINGDGYILKMSSGLDCTMFIMTLKIKRWLTQINDTIHVYDYMSELLEHTIPIWSKKILTHPSLASAYTIRKIFNINENIKKKFQEIVHKKIVELYNAKQFENREYCHSLISLLRSIKIEIKTDDLKAPASISDFIFWTHTGILNDTCVEKALEKKTHMHFEYLYTVQDDIRKWESILKHRPFDFLTVRNIKRSFEEGHTNEWIRIFKNLKSYNVKNSVAQRVWKALQKHVLSEKTLSDYNYPNVNDGSWVKKDNIKQYSWVLVNEVVMSTEHLNVDELEIPILTWVPGSSNVLERAITMLDKNMWREIGSEWIKYKDETLLPGVEIKCSKGEGHVISWPHVLLFGGEEISLNDTNDIYFRYVSFDYKIESVLRWSSINFIRNLLYKNKTIDLKDRYRSTVLELLKPNVTANILSIDWLGEATCINIDKNNNIWIGEYQGSIKIVNMKRFSGSGTDYIEINNGHTESINSIEFVDDYAMSGGEDGEIRIWDIFYKHCISYINVGSPVKCLKIASSDTVWYIDANIDIWSWNFKINQHPISIHSTIRKHVLITPTNSTMSICGNFSITIGNKMSVWFNRYPYDIKTIEMDSSITCVSFLTEEEAVYGTYNGEVYIFTINDNEKVCTWSEKGESCTCIVTIDDEDEYSAVVGTQSGKIVFISLESDEPLLASWKANNSIVEIRYKKPKVFILTSDYSIYTIAFDNYPIEKIYKTVDKMIYDKSWKRYITMPKNISIIQSIILSAYQSGTYDFSNIISTCIENYDNRKAWCTPEILDVVLEGVKNYPKKYKQIVSKLFCFKGKLFKCSLCLGQSTSPKSNPISMLKTCGHRYHTKCIHQHVKKTFEWDEVCLNSWALNVTLKCPECREVFGKNDIMEDRYISEICKYESEEEEEV